MANNERKIPKINTQQKWKESNTWLTFTKEGMKCTLCCQWEEKIHSCGNFSEVFLKGSTNYRLSSVNDHAKTDQHKKSVLLTEQQVAANAGEHYRQKITQNIPINSPIAQGFKKMAEGEKDSLKKLFDLAYLIAKKGRPYSDFSDFVALEKLHGVKYCVRYDHRNACSEFIKCISENLFEGNVKQKLTCVNFVTVLCDGSTDSAVIEKECIYVLFVDPDTFEPTMSFFSLKDVPSQDAIGIEASIRAAFREHGLENLTDRVVFLASDGASVNSGLKNGLISKFRETGMNWVAFVWCSFGAYHIA